MKVTVLQEKLKEALSAIEKTIGRESTLPILGNILLKVEKNILNLITTNLETGIKWNMLAKTEKEGSVVLPTQTFVGFINSLPNKTITISSENNLVSVVCGKSKSIFKGLSADEFPSLPLNTEGENLTIQGDFFYEALISVANFTSNSNIKPELGGVYFSIKKELLKMVATDSFRLSEKQINLKKTQSLSKEYSFILPQRAVKELASVFGEKQKNIKLYFSPNQLTVVSYVNENDQPQIEYVSRFIEGEFPNYEEIIPSEFKTEIAFKRKEFLNQIKSASLFSGKINEINLKISSKTKKIEVHSQSADLGEYQSEIDLNEVKGEDMSIAFNHKFLTDGLSILKSEDCIFGFSNDDGPSTLKPADDNSYVYILMPIKKN